MSHMILNGLPLKGTPDQVSGIRDFEIGQKQAKNTGL